MRRLFALLTALLFICCGRVSTEYVARFENTDNPQIGYWFLTPDLLEDDKYLADFDSMCLRMPFDLVFLSARLGCDFHDTARYHEPFARLVARAHEHGVKIGIQLWDKQGDFADSLCQQVVTEARGVIAASGKARLRTVSELIRARNIGDVGGRRVMESRLLRVWAFRTLTEDSFAGGSLIDITDRCRVVSSADGRMTVDIDATPAMAGMTVYALAAHTYNVPDMFAHAAQVMRRTLEAYADIPLDGTALDEFSYMRIIHPDNMRGALWRDRFYSSAMAEVYRARYNRDLCEDMLYMRYHPDQADSLRAASINRYMKTMRGGPLAVEKAFYDDSKRLFGKDAFIGFHDTFHNTLVDDELWATGANWWTVERDYGHTDEHSSLPVQLGIALANASHNALYNMFYDPSVDKVYRKAATDLRYGIRTLYHAMNDRQAWGASLDNPEVMRQIARIEQGAAMLNRFGAPMPRADVLVVFGVGALSNWYPDPSQRGVYDINEKLDIEPKALALLNAGYMNALVPDELIENGQLSLSADGKAQLGGRVFDALIFLYPRYASEATISFLEKFIDAGGRLMIEGDADRDFDGNRIADRVATIRRRAVCDAFSVEGITRLGITPGVIEGGCVADDGSVVFTDYRSLESGHPATFSIRLGEDTYSGSYCGLAALKIGAGRIDKLASSGLVELRRNGELLLAFDRPAAIELRSAGRRAILTIEDGSGKLAPTVNNL